MNAPSKKTTLTHLALQIIAGLFLQACQNTAHSPTEITEKKNAIISGKITIKNEESPLLNNNIIILVYEVLNDEKKLIKALPAQRISGLYRIELPEGSYKIAAFNDSNHDLLHQKNESAGWLNPQEPIKLIHQQILENRHFLLEQSSATRLNTKEIRPDTFWQVWPGISQIGQLTTLDNPAFDHKATLRAFHKPISFDLEQGPGLYFLQPYTAKKQVILFIHDIGNSPSSFKDIISNIDTERFQPWVMHYVSGHPIDISAKYLYRAISKLQHELSMHNLVIVADGLGGLVATRYLELNQQSNPVNQLITIATPFFKDRKSLEKMDEVNLNKTNDKKILSDLITFSMPNPSFYSTGLIDGVPHNLFLIYPEKRHSVLAFETLMDEQINLQLQKNASKLFVVEQGNKPVLESSQLISLLNFTLSNIQPATDESSINNITKPETTFSF